MNEYLLLVYTSGHAFGVEKVLKKKDVPVKLGPIPRGVGSDCGICIRFNAEDLNTIRDAAAGLPFEIQGIVPNPEAKK